MAKKDKNTPAVNPVPEVVAPTETPKPTLSEAQIVQAATNDPAMSKDTFELNGKVYKYVHLSYDYYLQFMLKIKPLLTAVVGTVAAKSKSTVHIPGIELVENPMAGVLAFAGEDIPDMVRIIVNNSLEAGGRESESLTVADIKKMRGITPMSLSGIVIGQVTFNNMITEFASFFVQMMPLLKQMGILTTPEAKTNLAK